MQKTLNTNGQPTRKGSRARPRCEMQRVGSVSDGTNQCAFAMLVEQSRHARVWGQRAGILIDEPHEQVRRGRQVILPAGRYRYMPRGQGYLPALQTERRTS